jgi:flagellar hook-associated protein 2
MATTPVATTSTITALGAGSGVDVKALASNLVDAERAPRKALIDAKISKSEANISGYAAIKFVLDNLKTAFSGLKDSSDFNTLSPVNSQPSALSLSAGGTATGNHSVSITSLAQAQRNISAAFAASNTALNGGAGFSLSLSVHGAAAQSIAISALNSTPAGIVNAINAAGNGISAQLINTGDASAPIKIMVTGSTGVANDFSLSSLDANNSAVTGLDFASNLQAAANAALTVDGVAITSPSNQVQGAIAGATLQLSSVTNGTATLGFSRDTTAVKSKLEALVTAYNEASTMLNVVSDTKSTVTTYGASLAGNSTVLHVRNQIRAMVLGSSSSPSGAISALRDLGLSIDKNGVLALDSGKLGNALSNNFDHVVTMLSSNRENLSSSSPLSAGVAGDAVKKLNDLLKNSGILSTQTDNANSKVSAYKRELEKLEARMTGLLDRYTQQFASMEALIGQGTSLRTSMKSSFDGLMSMYTNK